MARPAATSPSVALLAASIADQRPQASISPGRATTKWTKPRVMAGSSFKKTDRSKAKSASTTATTQPSRLTDGEFFAAESRRRRWHVGLELANVILIVTM